jgi:hypothetical protein
MPAGLSYAQMMKVPFIIKLIRRVHAPGNTMSTYYNLGVTANGAQRIMGRAGQYDIFDGTRSLVPLSSPQAPPVRINRKPIGSQPITVPRIYFSIGIDDEAIFGTRGLGMNVAAPVDSGGRQYITNQIRYAKTRLDNSSEYMTAAMFSGGWGAKESGTNSQMLYFSPYGTSGNAYNNATLVPAAHKTDINGIIDTSWDDPGADLPSQFMELNRRAAQVNGRRITEVWINGTTAKHLFNNSVIQAVGGSVNRIYSTLNPATEIGPNQKFPDTGITVEFGGLPGIRFHVYNQGYVLPGTSESFEAQIGANWRPYIPDNIAIMTPPPGDWCGMIEGSEPVQWSLRESGSHIAYGFDMGMERAIEPPRTDVKFVYNGAPTILEPYAVYYATVIF